MSTGQSRRTTRSVIVLLTLSRAPVAATIAAGCGGQQVDTTICTPDQSLCAESCAALYKDPENCGACGTVCSKGTVCFAGACATSCGGGTLQCGQSCVDANVDRDNCGACGAACGSGEACVAGNCSSTCSSAQSLCVLDGGAAYCASPETDNANCGGCGIACGPQQVCSAGVCGTTCVTGQTVCDADGGAPYCASLDSDNANCGACGNACEASLSCVAGACVPACPSVQTACFPVNAEPYCADTGHDPNNCGACGASCGSGSTYCLNGWCGCSDASKSWCGDQGCVDTQSDPSNCGGCNDACAGTCSDGRCVVEIGGPYYGYPPIPLMADATHVYLSDNASVIAIPNGGGTAADLTPTYVASRITDLTSDATSIYFSDGNYPVRIGRVAKSGGTVDILAQLDDYRSSVATDGVNVYVRGANHVYSVPVGGGAAVDLAVSDGASYIVPAICTNGTTVFWASTNGLMATPVAGGPTVTLVSGNMGQIGCAGSWVYFLGNNGYPSRTPTSGSGTVEIVSLQSGYFALGNAVYLSLGPTVWSIDTSSLVATPLIDGDLATSFGPMAATSSYLTWVDPAGRVQQVGL